MTVLLLLLFLIAAGFAGYMFLQAMKTGKENEQLIEQNRQIQEQARQIAEQNQRLEKWKPIINAEDKAKEILATAQVKVDRAMKAVEERTQKANIEAENIVAQARQKSDEMLADIKPEADRLTAIAKAMQNKIEGYGDEYLIPGIGLLDELAADFGYSDAGKRLKELRAEVRQMMKEGKAAECDYAEVNRRETAIAFVADAFNGKVEEILSRVRYDNYGKLAQEIRDAAILVDQNGLAFRNARVAKPYIEIRLEELKWATVVLELKKRMQEEQRAIREQMREEAKVQKEIEKARKEAEKLAKEQEREQRERDALRKALDEARARGEAESKLKEMEKAIAEKDVVIAAQQKQIEESRRKQSLAEQTKAGHVYIISNIGSFGENVYKIGMTRRLDPQDRVNELGDASVPFSFDVHGMIQSKNVPKLENRLHKTFRINQVNKVNPRKEFFRVPLDSIKKIVDSISLESESEKDDEKQIVNAHWTMIAEAADYRETLRREERITTDAEYRRQWEDRQAEIEESEPVLDESVDDSEE